ncbi:MAG: acyltransferase [Crenarchaeota archaeon]|nr:MAG: acyltransferase [Thermoproteota archaeon]RDJ33327.1 MAG: acyltransferase [Thermoproteota archaeon]RDJ36170.1 MAG: acyltransferase [Thermoproteota archaeon]RDJ38801.1 MAG: acyltransferase [Thermoproteota archaeon]
MEKKEFNDALSMNEAEIMEYYGLKGGFGRFRLKLKILRSWILHSLAYSSPVSSFVEKMQRMRGVQIGENCHFCPYVQLDLIYPSLIKICDNVTLGSNCMIFAHSNPTANLFLKKNHYPRKVENVTIESGVVLNPGVIVLAGVKIGCNSIISPGSVVTEDIPEYCIAVGNPARVIKKINH